VTAGNLAAVDCGTLSTRLLVSAASSVPIVRLTKITALGEGVGGSGALRADAVERALGVLRVYKEIMGQYDVQTAAMVGTSALRDASNREMFCRPASEIIGVPLQLLQGTEEAAISFEGATAELPEAGGPWLVVDIGGGSTELVCGPRPLAALSLDLGCVRVTERFFASDPPSAAELAAARAWLGDELRRAGKQLPLPLGALIGLAGTVSALACLAQGVATYRRDAVHHYRLSREVVERSLLQLGELPVPERGRLPGIEPARAPFVIGGTLVLATLMAEFGFEECLVSEADILDGLVRRLARSLNSQAAEKLSPPAEVPGARPPPMARGEYG